MWTFQRVWTLKRPYTTLSVCGEQDDNVVAFSGTSVDPKQFERSEAVRRIAEFECAKHAATKHRFKVK